MNAALLLALNAANNAIEAAAALENAAAALDAAATALDTEAEDCVKNGGFPLASLAAIGRARDKATAARAAAAATRATAAADHHRAAQIRDALAAR